MTCPKTPIAAALCAALALAAFLFVAPPTAAQDPFPGDLPGTNVGLGLPLGFEPSGAVWHERLHRLFVVDDGGTLACFDANGSLVTTWNLGGDLEAVAVADPASPFVYLGVEHPDTIIEFDIEQGIPKRWFSLTSIFTGPNNEGLEALTFARDPGHAEGGLFYAGLQADGRVYELELSIQSSAALANVTHLGTLTPSPGDDNISGLTWDPQTDLLYACYDGENEIIELSTSGAVSGKWHLPGIQQEGIALRGCRLFVAQDAGQVMRYESFPAPESCDTASVSVAKISISSGGVQTVALGMGPANAGSTYILLGTFTDTLPGFPLDEAHVPLVIDAYFDYTLSNPNAGPLVNTLGVLGPAGNATARIVVPAGAAPSIVGQSAYHCAVSFGGAGGFVATNPVPLSFEP